jgi:hypothetical protein
MYNFYVVATNNAGSSVPSEVLSVQAADPPTQPAAPTNLF